MSTPLDLSRSLRVVSNRGTYTAPVELLSVKAKPPYTVIAQETDGTLYPVNPLNGEIDSYPTFRIENEPIRRTYTQFVRQSANGDELRVVPLNPLGKIEVDVEGDKIVAVRLA